MGDGPLSSITKSVKLLAEREGEGGEEVGEANLISPDISPNINHLAITNFPRASREEVMTKVPNFPPNARPRFSSELAPDCKVWRVSSDHLECPWRVRGGN